MFSGGDSSREGVNNHNQINSFQLAAQSVCAMESNSIDWATLAQQWIQMKDFSATSAMPDVPPPPSISINPTKEKPFEEQGEADMEVEKEDDDEVDGYGNSSLMQRGQEHLPSESSWFIQQQQMQPSLPQNENPFVPAMTDQWNPWPSRVTLPPPVLHIPTTESVCFYKTADSSISVIKSTTPDVMLVKNTRELVASSNAATMDAAKRKVLPAWIREGLEKMEREKQKQIEREQKPKEMPDEVSAILSTPTKEVRSLVKSKSALTESDSSGNDDVNDKHDEDGDYDKRDDGKKLIKSTSAAELQTGKTYEQILADLMVVVRRTLTELLLEVTNEEIVNISQEAIKAQKSKASSVQVIRKTALSSLTGKLGLAVYADSSSDHSSSENEHDSDERSSDGKADSEEEIKANLRARRRAFAKTSEEIEERIAETELREEQKLKYYLQQEQQEKIEKDKQRALERDKEPISKSSANRGILYPSGKGFDKDFGEKPDSKFHHSNGKRQKERTTRFSDNKDSRKVPSASNYFSSQPTTNVIEVAAQKSASSSSLLQLPSQNAISFTMGTTIDAYATSEPSNTTLAMMATATNILENATKKSSSSTSSRRRRRHSSRDPSSDSLSNDSSDSFSRTNRKTQRKHSSKKSSRSSSSQRETSSQRRTTGDDRKISRRRDSSDSSDYKRKRSRHTTSSSSYSRRDRHRERRTRSRSRSKSKSSYSSSNRRKY